MQVWKCVSIIALAGLSGCASLPTNGPTGKQLEASIHPAKGAPALPITLVNVVTAADLPPAALEPDAVLPSRTPPPTDMVGPGDTLTITVFEAGVTLFASNASPSSEPGVTMPAAGVQAQALPPSRVNDDGDITLPYAGKLHVVGHTLDEIAAMIHAALRGMSQNPQITVNFAQDITNTVIVGGEVAKPGRMVLNTNRERLSDVLALAGGYRGRANDLVVRINRGERNADVRLSRVLQHPEQDIRAYPGDRISVIDKPETFSVLGASGRVSQLPFAQPDANLVEAIAAAGGVSPNTGDPAALFVFRYVQDASGKSEPVVYHFDMMQGSSFFLAQRFAMRDKDVLYFGSARANQPSKLIPLISQLFTPLMTVAATVNAVNGN